MNQFITNYILQERLKKTYSKNNNFLYKWAIHLPLNSTRIVLKITKKTCFKRKEMNVQIHKGKHPNESYMTGKYFSLWSSYSVIFSTMNVNHILPTCSLGLVLLKLLLFVLRITANDYYFGIIKLFLQ